jgi:hypothetical protein
MSEARPPKSKFAGHEDTRLIEAVRVFGTRDWWLVASAVPNRTARQCRERWSNYLNPRLTSHAWTESEDRLLLAKVEEMGCRWNVILGFFDGRSKNSLRNRYRSVQRRTGHAPRREAPETESPTPGTDDPFSFMDRLGDQWNLWWQGDCDPFLP